MLSLLLVTHLALAGDVTAEVTLVDGTVLRAVPTGVDGESLRIEERATPIPLYELTSIDLAASSGGDDAAEFVADEGPLIVFRDRGALRARVLGADEKRLSVEVKARGVPFTLDLATDSIRAFRLREAHRDDTLFAADLRDAPPPEDTFYVRQEGRLLRVRGLFRALDRDHLHVEYQGKLGKIPRQRIFGVVFAPVAAASTIDGFPALVELAGAGSLPATLAELSLADPPRARVRPPGSPPQDVPIESLRRIRFFSDRVVFLSALEPVLVEEYPLIGSASAFPWRRDAATNGRSIRLGGKSYRRGLGMHSRSRLEFGLAGEYSSFAARVGLHDAAPAGAQVTFRVVADGAELFEHPFRKGDEPQDVSLPVADVARLRLEVDFGDDGVDFGDHAVWADARVLK